MNEEFAVFIDMSLHSGKKRMFVYDLRQNELMLDGLVTHGSCSGLPEDERKQKQPQFNNVPNSHCSSLGKYAIAQRAKSGWGIRIKYWIDGLEKSNDNARRRVVVLHSWGAIGDKEVYPESIAESWGCPAVSNRVMVSLDKMLFDKDKDVLLWSFKDD